MSCCTSSRILATMSDYSLNIRRKPHRQTAAEWPESPPPHLSALVSVVPLIPMTLSDASADALASSSSLARCIKCPIPVEFVGDEACVLHRCAQQACGRLRLEKRGLFCAQHTCTELECIRRREPCRSFCDLHSCSHRGCLLLAVEPLSSEPLRGYCSKHACAVQGCSKEHVDWAPHCFAHQCAATHCRRSVCNLFSRFCLKHAALGGCNTQSCILVRTESTPLMHQLDNHLCDSPLHGHPRPRPVRSSSEPMPDLCYAATDESEAQVSPVTSVSPGYHRLKVQSAPSSPLSQDDQPAASECGYKSADSQAGSPASNHRMRRRRFNLI